jgi:hypothetical protein
MRSVGQQRLNKLTFPAANFLLRALPHCHACWTRLPSTDNRSHRFRVLTQLDQQLDLWKPRDQGVPSADCAPAGFEGAEDRRQCRE